MSFSAIHSSKGLPIESSAALTSGFINQCFHFGAEYDQILMKYDQNNKIHVENIQERHFLEIKKSNAKKYTGFGLWGDWGIGGGIGDIGYRGGGIYENLQI